MVGRGRGGAGWIFVLVIRVPYFLLFSVGRTPLSIRSPIPCFCDVEVEAPPHAHGLAVKDSDRKLRECPLVSCRILPERT